MEFSKYRMAAKLVAIFDSILTGLALLVFIVQLVTSSIANRNGDKMDGVQMVHNLLAFGVSLISFGLAVFLLRSTKSNEGHPKVVTAWIVVKILLFVIGALWSLIVFDDKSGFQGYYLYIFVASVIHGIPFYFVVKYRNELIVS